MSKRIQLPLEKIRFAYLEGVSIADIALNLRVGSWLVKARLQELGLLHSGKMVRNGRKKPICPEQLRADYMGLMSQPQIAEKYGVSQQRISKELKAIGLSWKDIPGRTRHLNASGREKREEAAPTSEEIASLLAYQHVKAALFKENRNGL